MSKITHMKGGYIEDYTAMWACYRCGEIMGDVRETENHYGYTCESCGEQSVISFLNALDILNDLYLKGDLQFNEEDMYIDDITEDD